MAFFGLYRLLNFHGYENKHFKTSNKVYISTTNKEKPGVHLVVSRENLSFELFDLPFDHVH